MSNIIIPEVITNDTQYGLNTSELLKAAPSIFGKECDGSRSKNYQMFNTVSLMDKLSTEGFVPTWACQNGSRTGRVDTRKHMIRFAQVSDLQKNIPDQERPEVVLINSHNGSSCYHLMAGIFRLVCSNGMIVASESFGNIKIRHMGHDINEVIESSLKIAGNFEKTIEDIREMKSIKLTELQARAFAKEAAVLRYGEEALKKGRILTPENLLTNRRTDDRDLSLWNVLNAVQENMLKGGVRVGRRNLRQIRNIDTNVRLNSGLWGLADQYRLATAA